MALTDEQMEQIEDEIKNDPRFLSGGARRYFRRVWIGYAVLALAFTIGIWAFTNLSNNNIKNQINALAQASCLSSIKTYGKFNDLVRTNIQVQQEALELNMQSGDKKRAAINKTAIHNLKQDFIIPPTPLICKKPILK